MSPVAVVAVVAATVVLDGRPTGADVRGVVGGTVVGVVVGSCTATVDGAGALTATSLAWATEQPVSSRHRMRTLVRMWEGYARVGLGNPWAYCEVAANPM